MRRSKKKVITFILILSVLLSTFGILNTAMAAGDVLNPTKAPAQIALSMTSQPETSMNINWTTIDTSLTDPIVTVWMKNKNESTAVKFNAKVETRTVANSTIVDSNNMKITKKNFYSATITGLKPNTEYSYRCGVAGAMSNAGSFKTAPNNNGEYTFIYVSDSQVSGNHSKAWQANLDIAKKMYPGASFIYIAGDLTNTTNDEGQWESFFNQPGNAQYNNKFNGSFISEVPLAAAMGNHDASGNGIGGMGSHYSFGSDVNGVPVSYAFDYGAMHMIILNLENSFSQNNAATLAAQTEFLRNEVAKAKAADQWTIVGFHKSIYSGADHMDDTDVIFNRKYWGTDFCGIKC